MGATMCNNKRYNHMQVQTSVPPKDSCCLPMGYSWSRFAVHSCVKGNTPLEHDEHPVGEPGEEHLKMWGHEEQWVRAVGSDGESPVESTQIRSTLIGVG